MKAKEVHLVHGRLKFGGSKNAAPFPSAVAVFHSDTLYKATPVLMPNFYPLEKL
jgi:hypothetical protein